MPRLPEFAKVVPRFVRDGAVYWLRRGRTGELRPRLPRRFGQDRQATGGRHTVAIGFYGVALAAWSLGAARRRGRVPLPAVTAAAAARRLDLLDPAQCAALCERVHALRHLWVKRREDCDFFTLGPAGYLDCGGGKSRLDNYLRDARSLNPILLDNFAPLYAALTTALTTALAAPCRLADRHAVPGFHVWLGAGIPRAGFDAGSVHFDLQYDNLGMDGDKVAAADLLSFTLPLRLPRAGGGLNVWDVFFPQPVQLYALPYQDPVRIPYEVGRLVVHTGHELHQIAPVDRIVAGDERICLQGHGIRRDGTWLLYW